MEKTLEDQLNEMEVGDEMNLVQSSYSGARVERVPGGWNYIYTDLSSGTGQVTAMTAVFVPNRRI